MGDVAFARSTINAIVTLCIDAAVDLGEVALSIWRVNGYRDYETTSWFEFRSLGQAVGVSVDEPGELIAQIVRSNTTSRAMLGDAVKSALVQAVRRRPHVAAYLASALFEVLGDGIGGPPVGWSDDAVTFWRHQPPDRARGTGEDSARGSGRSVAGMRGLPDERRGLLGGTAHRLAWPYSTVQAATKPILRVQPGRGRSSHQ